MKRKQGNVWGKMLLKKTYKQVDLIENVLHTKKPTKLRVKLLFFIIFIDLSREVLFYF